MDVFISYNTEDRPFAERLAKDLAFHGLHVWWDQWEMKVGDSLTEKIQDGISRSSWLAVVLSPRSVKSPWVKRELAAALAQEIESEKVVVLPVLVADCIVPPFLRDKIYADFRSSYRAGLGALLRRLAPPFRPDKLRRLLSQSESQVLRAFSSLDREGSRPTYRRFLLDLLSDDLSENRLAALFALGTVKDPDLRTHLISMLSDPSSAVRGRVAFYLGRFRRREALPAIERLMQDQNPAVRSAARTAYKEVTGAPP